MAWMTSSVLRAICKELDGQESCGGFLLHQIKSVYVIFQRILQATATTPLVTDKVVYLVAGQKLRKMWAHGWKVDDVLIVRRGWGV